MTATKVSLVACSFLLLNQRQDVVFIVFQNISQHQGFEESEVVARSKIIKNAIPNQPFGAHLALTGNPRYWPLTVITASGILMNHCHSYMLNTFEAKFAGDFERCGQMHTVLND